MERSEFDPATDWSDHGPDTALEEPMQYLGLGGGGGGGDSAYPERPGEPDCIYYLRTGSCGYGARCRFNHPHDRAVMAYGGARAAAGDFPERAGQPVCQHYLRTGSCKFASSCKYHHPRLGDSSAPAATLNFYGYPLRPGEKECSYYTKTGQCKFGVTCKFHHPQSINVQGSAAAASVPGPAAITPSMMYPTVPHASAPSQQFGVVAGNWQVARPHMVPGSYLQGPYGPMLVSTGVVPVAGWTPYMTSHNALAPPSVQSPVGAGQVYGMPPMSPAVPVYNGTYPPILSSAGQPGPSSSAQNEPSHPERPGQPVCQHYLRTGECKYGSFCRYHHPAEWSGQKASFTLTPMGLPLRPGAPTCIHFTQHGVCRFGPTCKFNHPMGSLSYSPSASSLSDMPVAPYPLGSSIATLAPSSSSSDLRIDPSNNSPSKTSSLSSISSGTALSRSASIPQPSPSPGPSSAKR